MSLAQCASLSPIDSAEVTNNADKETMIVDLVSFRNVLVRMYAYVTLPKYEKYEKDVRTARRRMNMS